MKIDLQKLTATENYDADFAAVKSALGIESFESDAEKSAGDAINNTWVEGITLAEWIDLIKSHPWYSAASLKSEADSD